MVKREGGVFNGEGAALCSVRQAHPIKLHLVVQTRVSFSVYELRVTTIRQSGTGHCIAGNYRTVHNTVLQPTVYSVQCTVYSVQCKVYSVQYTVYCVQYKIYSEVVLLRLWREPQCSSVWGVKLLARLLLCLTPQEDSRAVVGDLEME